MENRSGKIAVLLLLTFLLSACYQFEMRGFFFSYESADERFSQSEEWNKNNPFKEISVPTDEYSIFAMSDSHVGGTANLDIFINDAIESNATAAVMAGDLTTGHAEDYDTFLNHLPDEESLISFPIVGNHDLYFDGWKQYYSLFGSSTYLFTVKTPLATDLFICLDSGSGTLGSEQLAWLKNILETERPNYRYCVLFTHNNFFRTRHTASTNPQVEELHVLMELCVKHNIDMVVTGHDHRRSEEKLGNTLFVSMDALLDDYNFASYLKLHFKQDEINYEFVDL
ncbi:MAG: metallophosphoesterase [Bacteroidota bacterium]